LSAWDRLLNRALVAIDRLAESGTPLPRWVLGGGTALMIHRWHRSSKDIDLFNDDPQYLGLISPRLNNPFNVTEGDYDEAAHYVKLRYQEGEIDVIVSAGLSRHPQTVFEFEGRELPIETPVEIALKKLFHRAASLKPRDIFDIGVVLDTDQAALTSELAVLSPVKQALETRLATLPEPYFESALAELDIFEPWESMKARARPLVQDMVRAIP
jgi:hypothetical protein